MPKANGQESEAPLRLYLCEKPSQANDLAAVLGARQRGDGCMHDGAGTTVTWAYGHLLEQWMPEQYDEALKSWSLDTLPIVPEEWGYNVKSAAAAQFKVVQTLIKRATGVVIATDFDREGEAIARSIIERTGFTGPIKRLCLTALDPASIRKALNDMREGEATLPLYHAALSRQRADWLVGMNISRLYTVLARSAGYRDTLHIGRVLSPTMALVCQRDRDIRGFKPSPFWTVIADVHTGQGSFHAVWAAPAGVSDSSGRCVNHQAAQICMKDTDGVPAEIVEAISEAKEESAELPFDLTALQQHANRRWAYTADQVLAAAQSLYEKHKATTYPRTDCRHLPTSQAADVPDVLAALRTADPAFAVLVDGADAARSSRMFNDQKVTAHHAIIPTTGQVNLSAMSEIELRLYDAVRRSYVAQFYPKHEYQDSRLSLLCAGHRFSAQGRTTTRPGWLAVVGSAEVDPPEGHEPGADDVSPQQPTLPAALVGERCTVRTSRLESKATRPPAHFTDATLLAAMANIARFVPEEQFKRILQETAGLGTSATRAGIIQGAVDRGYFERRKRQIVATAKAQALVAILPPGIKSPGLTAAWEQELERISTGHASMDVFMGKIGGWIRATVEQLKAAAPELTKPNGAISLAFANAQAGPPPEGCFACARGKIHRIKGSKGFFWKCLSEECGSTFDDSRGTPVDPAVKQKLLDAAPCCPECAGEMRLRTFKAPGEKRAKKFWGCSDYPNCKGKANYKSPR